MEGVLALSSFQIGDQVTLLQPYFGLPAGTVGTIIHIYKDQTNYCRVQFNSINRAHPIPCDALAKVQSVEQPTSESAQL